MIGYHHYLAAVLVLQARRNNSPTLALAAEDGTQGDYCSAITTCRECLNEEACAHWTIGKCMSDCLVMDDAACYRAKYSFEGMSPDEICTRAENDDKDEALCVSMDDCTSCVGAVKSDGVSTCMWFGYEEDGFCATGCGMIGCGVTTCTATNGVVGDSTSSSSTTPVATTSAATTTAETVANTATTTGATTTSGSITITTTSSTTVSVEAMSDPSSGSMTNERLASKCTVLLVSFALAYCAL